MLDTLSVAQEMTAGGIERDQAEVIANAMRKVAEQGDHVTADQFKAGLAEIRTEIAGVRTEVANFETRLIRWMVGTVIADDHVDLRDPAGRRRVGRPMGMTTAERQRRWRERRAAGEPVRTFQRPKDRRPRPKRSAARVPGRLPDRRAPRWRLRRRPRHPRRRAATGLRTAHGRRTPGS